MFNDKVVLVTGGSSGIGEATALLFAKQGADVAFTYKTNKQGADEVLDRIQKIGRKTLAIQADLVDDSQAKKIVDETIKEFGRIDVVVNNAGGYIDGDEWDGSADIWLKSLEQNLVSVMSVSKYVAEVFQKQNSGIIVNVASRHGMNGVPDASAYSAAKAGVINVTQAYAKLLTPFGRANVVSPSATDAGYWRKAPKDELEAALSPRPNHKLVDPNTVAEKIVFLASGEAQNINGQNFPVTE